MTIAEQPAPRMEKRMPKERATWIECMMSVSKVSSAKYKSQEMQTKVSFNELEEYWN